jgi:gamma-glutamylcyclotransferase (GGCT)/AIG2-like uncharacterized protein YtfP
MASAATAVFVYGTLKPGRSRWHLLEPFAEPGTCEATVPGRLWQTPYGWPAMTDGTDPVPGVVVPLRQGDVEDALSLLDEIEGVGTGLFRREEVTVSGVPVCWTYRWPTSTEDFEPVDGAW